MSRPATLEESCACGATMKATGDYLTVGFRQDSFHQRHAACKRPAMGLPSWCRCPDDCDCDGAIVPVGGGAS